MAYDEGLADQIRARLAGHPEVSERKMFGGLCFLTSGNMVCGVVGEELMVRIGAEAYDAALSRPGARPMDFTGRPMKGMLYVDQSGIATALDSWLDQAYSYASSLPPKTAKSPTMRPAAGRQRRSP